MAPFPEPVELVEEVEGVDEEVTTTTVVDPVEPDEEPDEGPEGAGTEVVDAADDTLTVMGMAKTGALVVKLALTVLVEPPEAFDPSICPDGAVGGGGVPCPTRAPIPHGMASPFGCVAFGGWVDCPLDPVIVNRVVQVAACPLAVNW